MEHGGLRQGVIPREIYEQASPAVVMVMGHADGGRKGSGGTGSIIQSDGLVLTNAHVVIEEQTGKPFARLSVFLKLKPGSRESQRAISPGWSAPRFWPIHSHWILPY